MADQTPKSELRRLAAVDPLELVERCAKAEADARQKEAALAKVDHAAANILRVVDIAREAAETMGGVTFVNATEIRSFVAAALGRA